MQRGEALGGNERKGCERSRRYLKAFFPGLARLLLLRTPVRMARFAWIHEKIFRGYKHLVNRIPYEGSFQM